MESQSILVPKTLCTTVLTTTFPQIYVEKGRRLWHLIITVTRCWWLGVLQVQLNLWSLNLLTDGQCKLICEKTLLRTSNQILQSIKKVLESDKVGSLHLYVCLVAWFWRREQIGLGLWSAQNMTITSAGVSQQKLPIEQSLAVSWPWWLTHGHILT